MQLQGVFLALEHADLARDLHHVTLRCLLPLSVSQEPSIITTIGRTTAPLEVRLAEIQEDSVQGRPKHETST